MVWFLDRKRWAAVSALCFKQRGAELTESHAISGTDADWIIPQPHDTAPVHLADGGVILLRRYGNPDGPRLVLSHGSGFSVDAYVPFWSLLLPRFDLIGYDLRNHGRNPLGDLAAHHMPMMVWDNLRVVRAIDRYFGPKPKIGVYHSVSAAIAVFQAVEESSFTALVLFDPPVCPPGLPVARQESIRAMAARMAARARARQNHFERCEDLAKAFGAPGLLNGSTQALLIWSHAPRYGGESGRKVLSYVVRPTTKPTSSSSSTNGQSRSILRRLTVRSRSSAAIHSRNFRFFPP